MASTKKPRPSALARAEHGGAPVKLAATERRVLDEALRRGADLSAEVEAKVTSYGRWLLEAVFANDVAAALDDRTKNPVWLELVRRAGGPTLHVSRHVLYSSVRIAAYDRRITDQSWRNLDAGRKELLLPLTADARLREAAQHVAKFDLSHAKTRAYVTELLGAGGTPRRVSFTAPALAGRVKKLRESLDGAAVQRRLQAIKADLEPAQREALATELERLRGVLAALVKTVRGR